MIVTVFIFIIAIQAITALLYYALKEKHKSAFAASSVSVSVLLLLIFEFKPHHQLRQIFGVPNTVFYIISLILLLAFFIYFHQQIMQNQYVFLVLTVLLWLVSGSIDLLSDKGLIGLSADSTETALIIAGSISYLVFYALILFQNKLIIRVLNKYE